MDTLDLRPELRVYTLRLRRCETLLPALYILHHAIAQDVVTRSVAVSSQGCRSNLVVSIAQD